MVFSIVFTNCHLPFAIFHARQNYTKAFVEKMKSFLKKMKSFLKIVFMCRYGSEIFSCIKKCPHFEVPLRKESEFSCGCHLFFVFLRQL